MYTLYRLTNTITSKVYIGITKHTVEKRWSCHLQTAFNKKASYKLSRAIRKYGKDSWIKEVLYTGIPADTIEDLEILEIAKHNSTTEGYNISSGGHLPRGIVYRKGRSHHSTDNTIYNFYNVNGNSYVGRLENFTKRFNLKRLSVLSMFSRKQLVNGWTNCYVTYLRKLKIMKEKRCTVEQAKLAKEKLLAAKKLKHCKPTVKTESAKLPKVVIRTLWYHDTYVSRLLSRAEAGSLLGISPNAVSLLLSGKTINSNTGWRVTNNKVPSFGDRSGVNNPMYGTTRPDHVKAAVSKRKKAEADQTLRTWIHTASGRTHKNVSTIALRDMYPGLNISHLKKITDNNPKYKTHKGWSLYVEKSK
jgi:hypothetical protein